MKSAFGSKRKARKIQVDEDEDGEGSGSPASENTGKSPEDTASNLADREKPADGVFIAPTGSSTPSNPVKKGFKKSSLRQSIAFDDLQQDENEGDKGPLNKPTIGRSSSLIKKKKKPASSRLSFGPGEIISGDAAEALEDDETFTPKKPTLGRRAIEGNAFRKSLPIPVRNNEDDEERPTYSKDYLNELKSSTPTTPKDLQALQATAEDEEGLDASELEGAMIVETSGPAHIPTEAEIREKKERRARLAHEKDFISFNDDDGDDQRQLSLLPRKREKETRLVREDEDLGEGFDEFVDDGRISLGKKQEREARKRHRKEMADMIKLAENNSDDDSDDSEAERRAEYEAAQTRAGMDGLHKHDDEAEAVAATQVPSKITPLPTLSECLERLQATLSTMQQELALKHKKVADLEKEKLEIVAREGEVQELLKQSGERFAALKADSNGAVANPQELVDGVQNGMMPGLVADRGLESFGNTPTVRPGVEDVG
ncbi:hypothetical protein LARI1_G002462 [Lachnellula arida]|uniref:Nineteen complex-related protein 2-domain-containing protein n=1 Tax=Lachnellula arida TaxID=1316785 RepID=A0A8T9BGL0_9HELO|nr:hypothetical protein LARI1_G002462 [Lachnellula arida]